MKLMKMYSFLFLLGTAVTVYADEDPKCIKYRTEYRQAQERQIELEQEYPNGIPTDRPEWQETQQLYEKMKATFNKFKANYCEDLYHGKVNK